MKLYRSQRDKKLFGLCGGLAEMLNVDATLIRLVVVITGFFSAGTTILLYFLACLVIPKEPIGDRYEPKWHDHSWHDRHQTRSSHYSRGEQRYERAEPPKPDIDEMMKDVEEKALRKELEELRAKVAQYEKGDQ